MLKKTLLGTAIFLTTIVLESLANASLSLPEITFDTTYMHYPVRGYLQTPAGGNPGSTSAERPTFKELNIDSISSFNVLVCAEWTDWKLLGGFQGVRADSTTTLPKVLTSQNVNFSAGDQVKADLKLDWYRLGLLKYVHAGRIVSKKYELAFGGDVVAFDYHYRLDSVSGNVDRSYMKIGGRLGAECDCQISENCSVTVYGFAPLPFQNTPSIWSLGFDGLYRLKTSSYFEMHALIGIGYTCIDYEDEQTVPNHIRVNMSPMLKLGMRIRF